VGGVQAELAGAISQCRGFWRSEIAASLEERFRWFAFGKPTFREEGRSFGAAPDLAMTGRAIVDCNAIARE
jgi:hypothetical protein